MLMRLCTRAAGAAAGESADTMADKDSCPSFSRDWSNTSICASDAAGDRDRAKCRTPLEHEGGTICDFQPPKM